MSKPDDGGISTDCLVHDVLLFLLAGTDVFVFERSRASGVRLAARWVGAVRTAHKVRIKVKAATDMGVR